MICAVVGGQFGSEGKGAIAASVATDFSVHVRVGAANAGHTVYTGVFTRLYDDSGAPPPEPQKHVLQQLPCAAYTNPSADLVLGPGALISREILEHEIEINELWRRRHDHPKLALLIDFRAHIVRSEHVEREQDTDLAERIGSTSTIAREGIGAATAARVMREVDCWTAGSQCAHLEAMTRNGHGVVTIGDAVAYLHEVKGDHDILLEGTQGTGLSLTTGFPPYTTSRNVTAAGLVADCGLSPADLDRCIVVMRTFPIRVAGNSGPFYPDSDETTFGKIGVDPECTTVTKLVRRVATFSLQQARDAVRLNRAPQTEIALTFMDYICPKLAGRFDLLQPSKEELVQMTKFIQQVTTATGVHVTKLGTGPHSLINAVDLSDIEPVVLHP